MNFKRISFFIFLVVFPIFVYSHPKGEQHDNDLCLILFGVTANNVNKQTFGFNSEKIKKLESACYLAIDFCKGQEAKGQRNLEQLELDKTITLESIVTPGNNPYGTSHERYTHLGWDVKYYHGGKNAVAAWIKRRDKILVNTVDSLLSDLKPTREEVELFSMLCYYIHLLGDHAENKAGSANDRMMFSPRKNNRSENKECVIDELIYVIENLFRNQDTGPVVRVLESIKKESRNIDDNTEKGMMRINKYATQTIEMLQNFIPEYVRNCDVLYFSFYLENESELVA